MINTGVENRRKMHLVPLNDSSLKTISTETEIEISGLINIVVPKDHPCGQKRYIITGGPGTGKTTIINELSKRYAVIHEAATTIIEKEIQEGIAHPWQWVEYPLLLKICRCFIV